VKPERVVQTFELEGFPGAVSVETLTLTERGGTTTFTVVSRFDSIAARDGMLQSGMEVGAAETYGRLDELRRSGARRTGELLRVAAAATKAAAGAASTQNVSRRPRPGPTAVERSG
jgi:hypothetical protein